MKILAFLISMLVFSGDIFYDCEITSSGTVIIKSADIPENKNEINIPANLGGYTVSGIGFQAFAGCFAEKISIPDSVLSLESGAFMSCNALKDVYIGNGVPGIPDDCFFACPSLYSIRLPDNLQYIGKESFFGCSELDITVPSGVMSIGENALGKYTDPHSNVTVSVGGFLIKGTTGSVAQSYAEMNGIDFIDMNNYKAGDVNNDGFINSVDASLVLSEYSKASTGAVLDFSKKQNITGDIDRNGMIDAKDASKILEIYAILSTGG